MSTFISNQKKELIPSSNEGLLIDNSYNKKEVALFTTKTPEQIQNIVSTATMFPMEKIVKRYMKDEGVSDEESAIHERELKRFLALCSIYHGPIGMRGSIDELWHTFIIFTEDYSVFCNRVAGSFIHHMPNDENTSKRSRRIAALRFDAAYKAVFEREPPEEVWPPLSNTSDQNKCMNGCGGRCGGCKCIHD